MGRRFLARIIVFVCASTLLTSCGWHLRGTLTLPEGLDTVYIVADEDGRVLSEIMAELLLANDVNVAETESEAQLTIDLLEYTEDRRVTTVGSNTIATEFELLSRAEYSVRDKQGKVLLEPTDTTVSRSYRYDQNDVLSKENEERLIQREMRSDLARQIIYRLRFLTENTTSTTTL